VLHRAAEPPGTFPRDQMSLSAKVDTVPSLTLIADSYSLRFRYGQKPFKRALKTTDKGEAEAAHTGQLHIPAGVDVGDFILSGGTLRPPVPASPPPAVIPSLTELVDRYLAAQFNKAESSVSTERTHLNNLKRELGPKAELPCDEIKHADLATCLQQRREKRHAETVKKERVTIRQLFVWAKAQGVILENPASNLPRVKGSGQRQRFRTLAEIDVILKRGGLTSNQQNDLWECLFLTTAELSALLELVRQLAKADFAHLLHMIPAYTGLRRGETLRLQWPDIDFEGGYITARSRKQSRQVVETSRQIDLHPELRAELLVWRKKRPKGQYVIGPRGSNKPLTSDEANTHFWQPLRQTTWQLQGKPSSFKIGYHSYRHSFASNLAAAGVDQRVIDEFMGHQTETMRKRYRHLFPKQRRSAIESFSLAASALPSVDAGG